MVLLVRGGKHGRPGLAATRLMMQEMHTARGPRWRERRERKR
jgi:hypothetical protein